MIGKLGAKSVKNGKDGACSSALSIGLLNHYYTRVQHSPSVLHHERVKHNEHIFTAPKGPITSNIDEEENSDTKLVDTLPFYQSKTKKELLHFRLQTKA